MLPDQPGLPDEVGRHCRAVRLAPVGSADRDVVERLDQLVEPPSDVHGRPADSDDQLVGSGIPCRSHRRR